MTNYYATGRTNYFAVKDAEAFKAEIDGMKTGLQVVSQKSPEGLTLVGLLSEDESGFVWNWNDPKTEEWEEIDWTELFARHLQDDWVAIIMETGAEGLRYVSGIALAFNSKGGTIAIDLATEITKRSRELGLGTKITDPTY